METDWLRPMSLGRILDHTFSLYRRYFLLLVGITAPQAVLLAAIGIVTNRLSMNLRDAVSTPGAPPDPATLLKVYATFWPVMVTLFLIGWSAAIIAHGATTTAVSRVYLGKPTGVVDSFSRLKGRMGRLFLVSLGVVVRLLGFLILLALGVAGFVAVGFTINKVVGAVFALLAGLGAIVVFFWVILRYVVAVPALIVEDSDARQAIARSVGLMRGHRLRGVVILSLIGVVSYVAFLLLQGPFVVFNMVAAVRHEAPAPWILAGMALGQAVSVWLTGPLGLVAFVLFYFDLRIRKEAFDLAMLMAGAGEEDAALKPRPLPSPGSLNL